MPNTDLIHALTFDFAFAAMSEDSLALADWVKADLLPVLEEVLDQHRAPGRRRIDRLEIDLGTVSAAHWRSELAQRLREQLSSALEEALGQSGAAEASVEQMHGPGDHLLEFLRTGRMPWVATWDATGAHKKLLRQLIDSSQATQVLHLAIGEAHMLTRLIRQFDAQELLAVASRLFQAWPQAERDVALAWAADEQQRLRQAGGDGEAFWRWFLPRYAHPISADTLLTGWDQAGRGLSGAASQGPLCVSPMIMAGAGFTQFDMRTIEQGIERSDFALLSPYWDRILASAPECLRAAHPRLWKQWLDKFDDDTLADILCVLHSDCGWLMESVAHVVPRRRLNALIRTAMPQWLAAPADSLPPQLVLAWVAAAAPAQSDNILGLFAFQKVEQGDAAREPLSATSSVMLRQSSAQLPSIARKLPQGPMQGPMQVHHAAALIGGLTPAEVRIIEQGLETSDFSLLAPYWERMLSNAPECLRRAHPGMWEQWLQKFDDLTLTMIVGVMQTDCCSLIRRLVALLPPARRDVVLRPALRQWLAKPADSLTRGQVLEWVRASVPEQSEHLLALFGAQAVEIAPAGAGTGVVEQADAQLLATARAGFSTWPPTQRDTVLAWADDELARLRNAGVDHVAFWRWFSPHGAQPVSLAARTAQTAQPAQPAQLRQTTQPAQPAQPAQATQDAQATQAAQTASAPTDAIPSASPLVTSPDALANQFASDRAERRLASPVSARAYEQLCATLREPHALAWLLRHLDAEKLLAAARILFEPWPTAAREVVMTWAADELQRLRDSAIEAEFFWHWFLQQHAHPASLASLARDYAIMVAERVVTTQKRGDAAALASASTPPPLAALDTQQMLAEARISFAPWPHAEREVVLAWAADELQRQRDAGVDAELFWRWLISQHAQPSTLQVLVREYTTACDRAASTPAIADGMGEAASTLSAMLAAPLARSEGATSTSPAMLAASFAPGEGAAGTSPMMLATPFAPGAIAAIKHGLASAQFDLLAPHWDRLLACAPEWICAEHPQWWATWLTAFDDDVLMDILAVVQADCKPMLERIGRVIPREHLVPLIRPALPAWFGAAPHRLSPRVVLAHVIKRAPQHADALAALFYAPPARVIHAGAERHAAVDSSHFREPLRVLAPLFSRAEIITISKCLNAGQFELLAPHWDSLLVLAPHWLRSEYPRLARTWLAGFDEEVLIDILSVVQADCSALIERLAAALPRQQLHAVLRPSLARWFDVGLDRLAPRNIIEQVLRASPGSAAKLQTLIGGPAGEALQGDDSDSVAASLEGALQRGDPDLLLRIWPSVLMSQRPGFRRIWQQLPTETRDRTIERFTAQLTLAQLADVALILQPRVAMLMAELQRVPFERQRSRDFLGTALVFLLHADVATVAPDRLMHAILEQHPWLTADLAPGPTRHIAAAMLALRPVGAVPTGAEQRGAFEQAQRSADALRSFVDERLREDAQFGQLNSAQLHRLVQAWTGLHQAGEPSGTFLSAIEAGALRSASPHAFFGQVLRQAARAETIDLDDIGDAIAPAPLVLTTGIDDIPDGRRGPNTANAPAFGVASPLHESRLRDLPQRLADAMLGADLSALDAFWPAIVMHHPGLLAQAAQRYLGRMEARQRLIASTDAVKLNDVLRCLSAPAAQFIAPLLNSALRFSAALPTTLAAPAFQKRVLRFAFAQVMDYPASIEPSDWVAGLLSAVLPASSQKTDATHALLAHAWYELLRSEDSQPGQAASEQTLPLTASSEQTALPMAALEQTAGMKAAAGRNAPLKSALEQTLFGRQYLAATLQRLRTDTDARMGPDTSLPEKLLQMLTIELCDSHPALTDCLLADGHFAAVTADVFSAAEWQALARAQLQRQEHAGQRAFWREFHAHLAATAGDDRPRTIARAGSLREEDLQTAFAAAFSVLKVPAPQAADAANVTRALADAAREMPSEADATGVPRSPADAAQLAASADTVAVLLMRASAPDSAARSCIVLLVQRLLANAGATPQAARATHAALQSALSHQQALDRLVSILPGPTLARLLSAMQPGLANVLPPVLRALADILPMPIPISPSAVPAMLDRDVWRAIFEAIFAGPTPTSGAALLGALVSRLARQHPQAGPDWQQQIDTLPSVIAPATPAAAMAQLLQPLSGPPTAEPAARAARTDVAPVAFSGDANLCNAGLVIIAPYIERLFTLLEITHDGVFVSEETRQRGLHLLQYVVTAEESTPEYLLALNKLLCGMPAAVPAVAGISISDKERDTIEQMLKGVIGHWSALGSSSIEALRETFLQRDGCLYYQDDAWHLKIPQRTFDMLLDRLPWGYKMIKFSWMPAPLNVTWRD